jgi:hypothetical protein
MTKIPSFIATFPRFTSFRNIDVVVPGCLGPSTNLLVYHYISHSVEKVEEFIIRLPRRYFLQHAPDEGDQEFSSRAYVPLSAFPLGGMQP